MELTPAVVVIAVVVVIAFVVLRWGRRHEAAAPADAAPPARASALAPREARESQPLVEWLLERASEQTGISLANDSMARGRIADAAAKAMEDLRAGRVASVNLPFLAADARGPRHFSVRFKRSVEGTFELQS